MVSFAQSATITAGRTKNGKTAPGGPAALLLLYLPDFAYTPEENTQAREEYAYAYGSSPEQN